MGDAQPWLMARWKAIVDFLHVFVLIEPFPAVFAGG